MSGGHAKSWVFLKNMMYRDTAFHLLPLASFSTQLVISEQQVKTMLENFILLDAVFISLYEGAGSYLVSSLFYWLQLQLSLISELGSISIQGHQANTLLAQGANEQMSPISQPSAPPICSKACIHIS